MFIHRADASEVVRFFKPCQFDLSKTYKYCDDAFLHRDKKKTQMRFRSDIGASEPISVLPIRYILLAILSYLYTKLIGPTPKVRRS